jgi:hypothetical protein
MATARSTPKDDDLLRLAHLHDPPRDLIEERTLMLGMRGSSHLAL